MVGDGDDIVTLRAAKLLEPRITQPPSGHFHRFARALHLTGRVETSVVTRHAQFGSLLSNQHFVFVAFGPRSWKLQWATPVRKPLRVNNDSMTIESTPPETVNKIRSSVVANPLSAMYF